MAKTVNLQKLTTEWREWARRTSPAWSSFSDAVRQLGCHVETLRLWVRDGGLSAVRGPHGAYYVDPGELPGLLTNRRSRSVVPVTPEATERVWAQIESGLSPAELALLSAARQNPTRNRPLYRLAAVHLLTGLGLSLSLDQVAAMLGISARHARRLGATSLRGTLLLAVRRQSPAGQGRDDARDLVRRLRARLKAAGFHPHTINRPQPSGGSGPTTAFKTKVPSPRDVTYLRSVGLTDFEIEAIRRVGIGEDELNELLIIASRQHEQSPDRPSDRSSQVDSTQAELR